MPELTETDLPVPGLPVTDLPVPGLPVTGLPVPGLPVTGLPVTDDLPRATDAPGVRLPAWNAVTRQRCRMRVGPDPAVWLHALEHDQDAQPSAPQHPGQRGAGHRAV